MAESIRIAYRVLSTRHWNAEHSPAEANRYKDHLEQLRPYVEPLPLQCLADNAGNTSALFGMFDGAFNVENPFAWNIVSFSLSLLELYVSNTNVQDLPQEQILSYISTLLQHNEPRIRVQTSELIKAASYKLFDQLLCVNDADCPNQHFHRVLAGLLVQNIVSNWGRANTTREALLGDMERIQMDDTTGWNHLESYLKALHALVLGISGHSVAEAVTFLHSITVNGASNNTSTSTISEEGHPQRTESSSSVDGVVLLISMTSGHINRHIRETTFKFVAQLLSPTTTSNAVFPSTAADGIGASPLDATVAVDDWYTVDGGDAADRMCQALQVGLQDDWSQIRLGAALACQSFLVSLTASSNTLDAKTTAEHTESSVLSKYWASLLPRVCMNRFYPAAAVQTVSQSTWREVLGPQGLGRKLLAHYAAGVATYYCDMTHARNHMTAEAACQAMAEFCARIDPTAVLPQVPLILETLCLCLEDDRWPVRDAAIVASGIVVRYFPVEPVTTSALPMLMAAWAANLKDFIWSIREHGAMAFGEALQCNSSSADLASQAPLAEFKSTVLTAALKCVSANLLHALHPDGVSLDASVVVASNTDGVNQVTNPASSATAISKTNSKAIKNFLPQSLLEADAAAKRRQAQPEAAVAQVLDSSHPSAASSAVAPVNSTANKSKDRKGWGCCIDCIELRTCQPWEVSHGAIYLLREISAVQPGVLFHKYGDSTASGFGGESADFTVAVQDPKDTYFGTLVYLLDTPQTSIMLTSSVGAGVAGSVASAAEDGQSTAAGIRSGVSQSKPTSSSSNSTESEQLVMAILEEVHSQILLKFAHYIY